GRAVADVLVVQEEETPCGYPTASAGPFNSLRCGSFLVSRNGIRIPVSQKISPMIDEMGFQAGSVFVIRDVSGTHAAQRALLESEAKQRALLNAFDGYIYTCYADRRIGYMNDKMIQRVGRDATGSVCHRTLYGFESPCEWCSSPAVFEGKTVTSEYQSPGDGRWYHVINTPMPDQRGMAKLALIIDITERKRMEQALEERKNFIESVVTNIQSGLLVLDPENRIRFVNPHAARVLDAPAEEAVSRLLAECCPELADSLRENTAGEIRCGSLPREPVIGFRRCVLHGPGGEAAGTIVSLLDLTEIIKIRREMQAKERLAAMGEVVARVAHEMRNPLFGITAAAQILDMELPLNQGQKELMNSLLGEARRLNNLVEELLDSSKEMKLKKRPVKLAVLIDEVLAISCAFLGVRELRVENRIPPELEVLADRDRLSQVVLNLLKNAADASPAAAAIVVEGEEQGGRVSFSVSDSGSGVPADRLERIFDVFYTTKRQGTGLGLYITRRIVEFHGGTVAVSNGDAGGAVFTVSLPRGEK
ncbi:MAG TPA: ATP-binding protein, partial [Verrucomicrobiae bacterium]|nr:ATP-binding protein [Verrucomicrobiae bacterium]